MSVAENALFDWASRHYRDLGPQDLHILANTMPGLLDQLRLILTDAARDADTASRRTDIGHDRSRSQGETPEASRERAAVALSLATQSFTDTVRTLARAADSLRETQLTLAAVHTT